jgi:hypothetical protein
MTNPDPHGLAVAIGSLGMFSRRAGKAAFLVIASTLEPGERVEVLVQGKVHGEDGAAVLTDRRIVLANDREWKPEIEVVPLGPGLTVQGWQDDRAASLTFERGGNRVMIEQVGDRELAQRLAVAARARATG